MPRRPPIHRPAHSAPPDQRRRDYDRQRGGSTERGYTARWQRASKQFLRQHPLCRECAKATPPRTAASSEVDHIIPHRGDMTLFWDRKNWQALCKTCHSRKTATEDSNFARPST